MLRLFFLATLPLLVFACDCGGSSSKDADASHTGDGGDGGGSPDGAVAVGGACDASDACQAGLVCAGGECVSSRGVCETDDDCGGDTYCCADGCLPAGETDARCVAYGSGPRGEVNDECRGEVLIGHFAPNIQCEWTVSAEDDFGDHRNVLATPLVADLPHDSGSAAEIVIVTYNNNDGGGAASIGNDPQYYGVIRILNGQDCSTLENIDSPNHRIIAASAPAIGDLDGDGRPEIVALRANHGLVAFTWNEANGAYESMWAQDDPNATELEDRTRYDGPSIHDIDGDGFPEIISGGEVFDGRTGARLNPGQTIQGALSHSGMISVLGDVDADGEVELVAHGVYSWSATAGWELKYPGSSVGVHFAYADFGTPGATPGEFDPTTLDGIAEIVSVGAVEVRITTLDGQVIMNAPSTSTSWSATIGGGPPTIGDFDGDGFPEIGVAGGASYRVYDLDCAGGAGPGCEAQYIRWSQTSQDASSAQTGSSIFDFDGDGQAEVVYADECFARIYDGSGGEVLFSAFRSSCTWYENAVIADPDRDQNTEILIGSNDSCMADASPVVCPTLDPIHRGVRCVDGADCPSGNCDAGFCRCASSADCPDGNACAPALSGTPGSGQTCRANRPVGVGMQGLRVLRDHLDRWASSRPLWNQHAYSVTNVEDDGTIPSSSAWRPNFTEPGLNNYRQNVQGVTGSEDLPDITGRADPSACQISGESAWLRSTVCNRGNRAVGAALPATFYKGDPADGEVLCVSYTEGPVPVGGCLEVSCEILESVEGAITIVVNDDGAGGRTTVECNGENNADTVVIPPCIFGPG